MPPVVPSVHPPFHRVAAATRALLSGRGAAVRRSVLLVGRCVTRAPGARARVFFVLRTSRSSSLSSSLSRFCHAHVVLRTSRKFLRQPRRLRLSRAGAVSFSQGGRSPVHKLCRNPRITPEAVHLIHSLDANAFMQKENVRHPRPPRALSTVLHHRSSPVLSRLVRPFAARAELPVLFGVVLFGVAVTLVGWGVPFDARNPSPAWRV